MDRYDQVVQPFLASSGHKRTAVDVHYDDTFPINAQMDERLWGQRGAVWVMEKWDCFQTTFLLNGIEVPDWLYGLLNVDNNTCLPENGTADEVKDGILAVLEDSAQAVIRKLAQVLDQYSISIITSEVDLVEKRASIHCRTDRPVMQINSIMSNRKIREAVPRRARIAINTFIEPERRTDDYLDAKDRPPQQVVTREFYYEDGSLVRDEPFHWSAGTKHESGDIINLGGVRIRLDEERDRAVNFGRNEFNPGRDRAERRQSQVGTPFQPGERASWRRPRNR